MIAPRTLVLFDVDGTLIDSQVHILEAMKIAFSVQGLSLPSREEVLSIIGLSLFEAFEQLCPGADDAQRAALVANFKKSFSILRHTMGPSPLYPGALACLDLLKGVEHLVLGIATGKSRRGLDHVLSNPDLAGRFSTKQVADDHPSKPDPAMVLQAMVETGAFRGVMIGDTSFDMKMGRAAGLKTIGVSWGYHSASVIGENADMVIDHFEDLLPEIQNLWSDA
jgi:phosphoglycolate phosphatase